jgi:hypothetical protein
MAYIETYDESAPNGAIVKLSGIDDAVRQTKRVIRERLEGDPANPNTGILLTLNGGVPKPGSARAYVAANAAAVAALTTQDGRLAFAADTGRLYHLKETGTVEIPYTTVLNPSATGQLTLVGGIVTVSKPILLLSQTWNEGATVFTGLSLDITDTASNDASNLIDLKVGGTSRLFVRKSGLMVSNGVGGGFEHTDGAVTSLIGSNAASGDVVVGSLTNHSVVLVVNGVPKATLDSAGVLTIDEVDGNAASADKLSTARNINGVPFDGTADINIEPGTGKVLAADITELVQTLTSCGLTQAVQVGESWKFKWSLLVRPVSDADSGGYTLNLVIPAFTKLAFRVMGTQGSATSAVFKSAFNDLTFINSSNMLGVIWGASAPNGPNFSNFVEVEVTVKGFTAAGTADLRFARVVSSGGQVVKAGSSLISTKLT